MMRLLPTGLNLSVTLLNCRVRSPVSWTAVQIKNASCNTLLFV
jgi:hypothetical protein